MELLIEPGILDRILDIIQGAVDAAVPVLEGNVSFIFQTILIISIVFSGFAYATGSLGAGIEVLIQKVFLISGALFLITNWLDFIAILINSFAKLGLVAGGSGSEAITIPLFLSPSTILSIGFDIANQIYERANEVSGFFSFRASQIFLLFSAFVVGLSFLIVALQVFVTLLEIKFVTLGGLILLPFALLDRTTSLAQGVLGYVIAAGLKIFTLAVVVSFAFAIFPAVEIPPEGFSFTSQMAIMGTAGVFALLSLHAPSIAASMISGGPSLGVGAIGSTAATVAGATAAAYFTGSAVKNAAGAVGTGAASLKNVASDLHSAARGGASPASSGVSSGTRSTGRELVTRSGSEVYKHGRDMGSSGSTFGPPPGGAGPKGPKPFSAPPNPGGAVGKPVNSNSGAAAPVSARSDLAGAGRSARRAAVAAAVAVPRGDAKAPGASVDISTKK